MQFRLNPFVIIVFLLIGANDSTAGSHIPAFPGAEGFGSTTPGGRGGQVLFVTNLKDNGPGSLRDACNTSGPRTVVFRVSGTIELESTLRISEPYITIAGQTAPGGGICLKNYPLYISTHDVVVRYLRCRHGDVSGNTGDALSVNQARNVIIDHCSTSWSVDETLSITHSDSITVQWCFITESLNNSIHSKGAHGYGGIVAYIEDGKVSQHHNLWAHHNSRNPRPGSTKDRSLPGLVFDFRNNLIYNWGKKAGYSVSSDPVIKMNYIGNYLRSGPSTQSNVINEAYESGSRLTHIYIEDNLINDTASGWEMFSGICTKAEEPFPTPPMTTDSPDSTFFKVLNYAGATLPKRDAVDLRMVETVMNNNRSIIDSQEEVGGYPVLESGTPYPDEDQDGMDDEWEAAHGLDPNLKDDYNEDPNNNGYTNLEEFLNGTDPMAAVGVERVAPNGAKPESFQLAQNYPNPFNMSTKIRYYLNQPENVTVTVYNLEGRKVRTLVDGLRNQGSHLISWNGTAENGAEISSGIYYYKMTVGAEQEVRKMILLK
jgi:pectate lyase